MSPPFSGSKNKPSKVLSRFYEPRNELLEIYATENPEFAVLIKDETWCSKLAYLADSFVHLNSLNASMQGKEQNLFTSSGKLHGFLSIIKIWKATFENSDLEMFPLTADTDPEITSCLILEHLSVLEDKLQQYFPSLNVNEYEWVRKPFAVTTADTKHLSLKEGEELAELQADLSSSLEK
jgi:hypothetical protein